jgi:polar amino acid transport system permease protein
MLSTFNLRVILEYLPLFGQCLLATVWLSGLSLVGSLAVGILACGMRISPLRPVSWLGGAYIESIRATPLLAQLYFLYFGMPSLGIVLREEITGVLALTLNSGAYMAEILRAGIGSIARGQIEAGMASGLSYLQRMRHIVLPQAIGITIPPVLGQAIVLVKDSSLLSLISVVELTRAGQRLTSDRFMPAEGFFTTAAFYLCLYFTLKAVLAWSQRRLIHLDSR